jgi:L-asparaginase
MFEIITTGGTIDKVYNPISGNLEIGKTCLPELFVNNGINPNYYQITSLLQKDSLDLNREDREIIRYFILNSKSDQFLITHGTDTMCETANFLNSYINDRTIILTGSFIPFSFKNSDASFNVAFALASFLKAKKGVFIAMNGMLFPFNLVKKDVKQGRFVYAKN